MLLDVFQCSYSKQVRAFPMGSSLRPEATSEMQHKFNPITGEKRLVETSIFLKTQVIGWPHQTNRPASYLDRLIWLPQGTFVQRNPTEDSKSTVSLKSPLVGLFFQCLLGFTSLCHISILAVILYSFKDKEWLTSASESYNNGSGIRWANRYRVNIQ